MSPEEIKEKADQAVEMFFNIQIQVLNKNGSAAIDEVELDIATQCAILMYEDRVNVLQNLFDSALHYYESNLIGKAINESYKILNNLKERLK